jgi:hypothetical protein
MGRTEADRKITSEPWSSMQSGRKKTTKTTLRSGRSSALKKDLTEPTLLEMSGFALIGTYTVIRTSPPKLFRLQRLSPPDRKRAVTSPKHLFLLLALLLSLMGAGGCEKKSEHKNVCPIEGQPPEWSRQIDAQTCEYFHFSPIERQTHSWTAPCEQSKSR